MQWQCGRFRLDLNQPKIMGIVNMTPDSFSDGGRYSHTVQAALSHAESLLKDGAEILDIGGESSRPGADYVSPEEEWQRLSPVLREIMQWNVPVTVDTRRSEVMRRLLAEGLLDAVNDIEALRDGDAVELLAQYPSIGICLMHMQGLPENMQHNPDYHDVAQQVRNFLQERIAVCVAAGIDRERLLLDPGIGFGKTVAHNLTLLRDPAAWLPEDLPYLIGVSRKSLIGALIGESEPRERVFGSVTAAVESVRRGAHIVRVHDVKATRQALQVYAAYNGDAV
ncbi:MAG: dihydropteroate synthase [Neisseria sp.]|nr:dihydropteroate synthase [Neisseria sp.]